MLFPTHLLFTGVLASALWDSLPQERWLFLLIACAAALLPDVDNKRSVLGRPLHALGAIMEHRGLTHTPLAAALLWMALSALVSPFAGNAVLLGYLGHVVLDSFSKKGIAFLFPLSRRRVRGPVEVGTGSEAILAAGLALSLAILILF